ncbi:5-formyltetrahydrofolate cyclo-ligase [Silvimonas iriomotensis]|uniref:5-formyltetrahydrofolate cyclo-ligase n=1 Tax=Silvimonas iriomotensis TaxID=449662 RepID=A0ABQ2PCD0_9NEIS|nr:5-formyltetrahydrofolate cyclo-ligase [Silvimonas iriomotensis]GGP22915.1 5-formyltetrahydrofolate cyclo-ligase [Silvimonas iriomotensis]
MPSAYFPHVEAQKAALRRTLRQRRAALTLPYRREASLSIMQRASSGKLLRRGRRVAVYVSMASEISTWPLILKALQAGCLVYLPVVPRRGRLMHFVRYDHTSAWQRDHYGIPFPVHEETCRPQDLDVAFVPLLGFDAELARLGQGGGYYDTTFRFRRLRQKWKKPRLVGLAYDCQEVAGLPVASWDLCLDEVITETRQLRARIAD